MKSLMTALIITLAFLTASVQAVEVSEFTAALANAATRPDADKARDEGRKPAEVLGFLGIEEGMSVMDVMAAAGYYTEVLSMAVGPTGKVYMHNMPAALTGERGSRTAQAIAERLSGDRLANVERLEAEFGSLGIPTGSLDAALIALEIHELINAEDGQATVEFFTALHGALKSGGVLGVIEHAGDAGNDNAALHRGLETDVVAAAQAAGFTVADVSDVLRNPEDDLSKMVFDGSIRGKTDRYVLRLVKP